MTENRAAIVNIKDKKIIHLWHSKDTNETCAYWLCGYCCLSMRKNWTTPTNDWLWRELKIKFFFHSAIANKQKWKREKETIITVSSNSTRGCIASDKKITKKNRKSLHWHLIENSIKMYIENLDSLSSLMSIKRHYKKDSRYVNDLYTLTYDNCESLNTISLISSIHMINNDDVDDDNALNVSLILRKGDVGFLGCI